LSGTQRFLRTLEHPARTAIAAVVSLWAAQLCGLPEAYWASITTIIILQSTLGAAIAVSSQRWAGTALGAFSAALIVSYFGSGVWAYGAGILILGLMCDFLRLGNVAYRFAGITLAIVMLVPRVKSDWIIALHRFIEVSIGILVGLAITAIWPEREEEASPPAQSKPMQN
jgi:uncharacterized membrane protein YgaE (UPF0421/DUF939 family)